jgi:hypothetical protein
VAGRASISDQYSDRKDEQKQGFLSPLLRSSGVCYRKVVLDFRAAAGDARSM